MQENAWNGVSKGIALKSIIFTVPIVTRFFCPPDIPLRISSPIIMSAHSCKPSIWKDRSFKCKKILNEVSLLQKFDCPVLYGYFEESKVN